MSIDSARPWPRETALWRFSSHKKHQFAAYFRAVSIRRLLKSKKPFQVMILTGQKRSGNHVFLNWYMSQATSSVHLFNNVSPEQTPTDRHRQELRLRRSDEPTTLIFSYEDHSPSNVFGPKLTAFLACHHDRITNTKVCMMLRDPRNLIASRLKKWPHEFENEASTAVIVDQYKIAADIALSAPDSLHDQPFVPVLYNGFVSSAAYREKLSDALEIQRGSLGLNEVADYGHGSSFDGQDKSGHASQMDVFNRWRLFEDDPRFKAVFEGVEMTNLAERFDKKCAEVSS